MNFCQLSAFGSTILNYTAIIEGYASTTGTEPKR